MCELGKSFSCSFGIQLTKSSPLPPGACHNVQLEFLTLSTGLVGLAAVHVVDLDTRETTQITELPDIMVSK
jgi:hypothetical protein